MSAIGKRIGDALEFYAKRDYERTCLHLMPALDATAKRARGGKEGVGERIRGFIAANEALITAIGKEPVTMLVGNRYGESHKTLPEIVYKFVRTSVSHEGQLDPLLRLNEFPEFLLGEKDGLWHLPASYLMAIAAAVIVEPTNQNEICPTNPTIRVFDRRFMLDELWGRRDLLIEHVATKHALFADTDARLRRDNS